MLLSDLADEGMTMIIVMEMGFANRMLQTEYFLWTEETILEDTTPEELFNNPQHERTKEFLNKVLNC